LKIAYAIQNSEVPNLGSGGQAVNTSFSKKQSKFGHWDENSRDGPWPDPTQAYFWPAVNKRPTRLWPGYFLTQPKEIFLTRRFFFWHKGKTIENLTFLGETFQTQTQTINGWPDPGQKFLTRNHHKKIIISYTKIWTLMSKVWIYNLLFVQHPWSWEDEEISFPN